MTKYAIIQLSGTQYTIEEGKEYSVPKFDAEAGKKFDSAEVLAIGDGEKLTVGMPTVTGGKVVLDIIEQGTGEKVVKRMFRAKSRYHKTKGHRKLITRFKVVSIK